MLEWIMELGWGYFVLGLLFGLLAEGMRDFFRWLERKFKGE